MVATSSPIIIPSTSSIHMTDATILVPLPFFLLKSTTVYTSVILISERGLYATPQTIIL